VSSDELDDVIYEKSVALFDRGIYPGEQVILALNRTNTSGIISRKTTDNITTSAITLFPDTVFTRTVDVTPGAFVFKYRWDCSYYIKEGQLLKWEFDSSKPLTLNVSVRSEHGNYTVYYEEDIQTSKQDIVVNHTGVYYFAVRKYTNDDALLVFRSLMFTTPVYNISKCTLWSEQGNISRRRLDPSVKYIVIDSSKFNTSERTQLYLFDYEGDVESLDLVSNLTYVFIFVFVGIFFIILLFFILDMVGVDLWFCYSCTDTNDDEDEPIIETTEGEETTDGSAIMPTPGEMASDAKDNNPSYCAEQEGNENNDPAPSYSAI